MSRVGIAAGLSLLIGVASVQAGEEVAPTAGPVVSCESAGPPRVAWWAVPSRGPGDQGYYVGGGGSLFRGEPRTVKEGTWGWDYEGRWDLRRIWLSWNHGQRYQGGQAGYRTDGHPVPNIFALPPLPENHVEH